MVVKPLTLKQIAKAVSWAKKGISQLKIGTLLKVRKERVGVALRAAKVGKRRAPGFWDDVKDLSKRSGMSWTKAREEVKLWPVWGKKRAAKQGKKYKRFKDFWDEIDKKYAELTLKERRRKGHEELEEEMEDTLFETTK